MKVERESINYELILTGEQEQDKARFTLICKKAAKTVTLVIENSAWTPSIMEVADFIAELCCGKAQDLFYEPIKSPIRIIWRENLQKKAVLVSPKDTTHQILCKLASGIPIN